MADQLVSVITTTYKRENAMLERAIDSVLRQTYRDFELIIVDDNDDPAISKRVKDLIEEKNKKENTDIKLISYGKNMGLPYARNEAIKIAKGDFIAFLDDDDQWLERKLELQIKKFNECGEDTGIVYCSAISDNGKEKRIRKAQCRGDIFNKMIYRNYIGSPSFSVIRKKCFDEVGLFDVKLKSKQDYDLYLRICKKYRVDYVEEPLVIYWAQGQRISSNIRYKLEPELYFFEKHKEELMHFPDSYSHRLLVIGEHYYKLHDLENARQYFRMAIKAYRRNWYAYVLLWMTHLFRKAEKYYTLKSKVGKLVKKCLALTRKPVRVPE